MFELSSIRCNDHGCDIGFDGETEGFTAPAKSQIKIQCKTKTKTKTKFTFVTFKKSA